MIPFEKGRRFVMRFDWKKALKICACVFILFLCVTYWTPFVAFLKVLFVAAEPLMLGAFIAFFVNILMVRYEKWFFPKKKSGIPAKLRRPLCIVFSFLSIAVVLAAVIWLIVPQLLSCIQLMLNFASKIPGFMKEFVERAQNWDFIPD